jgi:glycosyltransferase involved in cell wall biosynthesis
MKIAIQAADLDHSRIDGTRVYIKNMLRYFGELDSFSDFLVYHKNEFNLELRPPEFSNYQILKKNCPFFWTQIRLSLSLASEKPDVLWMPMHNIPFFRSKKMKTVVTIHDLAFKYFPEYFTRIDLFKINFLSDLAIRRSDKIIAVSESSKKDILKFYPEIDEGKIRVIHHGFESGIFSEERNLEKEKESKNRLGIHGEYLLYVGALQPRKNLGVLIEAFERLKKNRNHEDLKLVLGGEKAWLFDEIFEKIEKSPYKSDIIAPGKVSFQDLGHLMRGAQIFCFPSLYEGFGIPILEAFASRVPVVTAKNSSLPEVAGDAAGYFDSGSSEDLAFELQEILENETLRHDLIERGLEQVKKFSWKKCAQETLEYLKN